LPHTPISALKPLTVLDCAFGMRPVSSDSSKLPTNEREPKDGDMRPPDTCARIPDDRHGEEPPWLRLRDSRLLDGDTEVPRTGYPPEPGGTACEPLLSELERRRKLDARCWFW
jgi:hypothetical protein